MSAKITNEHLELVIGKIDGDLRGKFAEAVAAAEGDECVTSLTYRVQIDAAKQKKPIVTVERTYKPAPVNEKEELLTLSVAELPLLDGGEAD